MTLQRTTLTCSYADTLATLSTAATDNAGACGTNAAHTVLLASHALSIAPDKALGTLLIAAIALLRAHAVATLSIRVANNPLARWASAAQGLGSSRQALASA